MADLKQGTLGGRPYNTGSRKIHMEGPPRVSFSERYR
jgi:hypothetical protein